VKIPKRSLGLPALALLVLFPLGAVAADDPPCDPNPSPDKMSGTAKTLWVAAIKKIGGIIAGEDAVKVAELIDDAAIQPVVTYMTTKKEQQLSAGLAKLMEARLKFLYPPLGLAITGGEIIMNGIPIAVDKMLEEGTRQQYEATIFGNSGESPIGTINNLYAEDPFFASGAVTNRGITPQNFGAKVRTEEELRDLWFKYYRAHLVGGPLGLGNRAEIDEHLAKTFPTMLQYWKIERVPYVLRELRVTYSDMIQREVANQKPSCDELLKKNAKPGEWVQDGIETRPEAPWKGVVFTPRTGTSVHFDIYNGDKDEHSWNAPPPIMTTAGWTAKVSTSTQPIKGSREYPIICVDGSGFVEMDNTADRIKNQCATCGGENGQSCSADKSFHMTPRAGASELEIRIGSTYAVTFIYRYHLVR
jgi:hypothetical protein